MADKTRGGPRTSQMHCALFRTVRQHPESPLPITFATLPELIGEKPVPNRARTPFRLVDPISAKTDESGAVKKLALRTGYWLRRKAVGDDPVRCWKARVKYAAEVNPSSAPIRPTGRAVSLNILRASKIRRSCNNSIAERPQVC